MDELLRNMGIRIMNRRKDLGLTQENVAEQAGLTVQTISSAERGTKALRPENIVKISDVLQVPTDYVLRGKSYKNPYGSYSNKISKLTPQQRYYLEQIIENYIAAVSLSE